MEAGEEGIKMPQNHNLKHPVKKRHLLLMRRGITGDNLVTGTRILENNISNVQKLVGVDGIKK